MDSTIITSRRSATGNYGWREGQTGRNRLRMEEFAVAVALLVRAFPRALLVHKVLCTVAAGGLRLLGFNGIRFGPMRRDIAADLLRNPDHQFPIPPHRR